MEKRRDGETERKGEETRRSLPLSFSPSLSLSLSLSLPA